MVPCGDTNPDDPGLRCTLPARAHFNHEDDSGHQWPNPGAQRDLARRNPPKGAGLARAQRLAAGIREAQPGN